MVSQLALDPTMLMLIGTGLGSLIGFFGLYAAFAGSDSTSRRFRPTPAGAGGRLPRSGIVREAQRDPSGLMKTLLPADREERTRIQRQLAHAGLRGKNAVAKFYSVRALLGIILPGCLLLVILSGSKNMLPSSLEWVTELSRLQIFQLISVLVAVGFFGPAYWLKAKVAARQAEISSGFPNALDLMQISSEAGLGFDAAMGRVAAELEHVSPAIAEEFAITQREILAGRDREKALMDMGHRMAIDEAVSFAGVILQSMRFGTSVSEALLTYAGEMRQTRELRAQEKANKLPVQMSGVLACLLLPAIIMISLSPVVIRYMRYFAE